MQERALQEVITLNEERLRIAEARLTAGFAAQTDALQARIDLNQRKADLLLQKNITATAKRNINRLLNRATDTAFDTQSSITSSFAPDFNSTRDKVLARNPTILSFQKSAEIAAILVEENRTLNKPRITGNAQLSAQRTDNGAGFLLNNTQAGFTVGAGLILPLYTGGNVQRQVETARVTAMQAQMRTDNQRTIVETELANQFAALDTQKQLLTLEEENLKAARENLSVSTERFRVGTTNGLEPQTSQNTLEQSLARRDMVLYNLKIAELRIQLLSGELQ
jgi:outer membrane protein TolC